MKVSISYKIAGGKLETTQASTIGELKAALSLQNYTAMVNGVSKPDSHQLEEGNFVTFAPAVKGGC